MQEVISPILHVAEFVGRRREYSDGLKRWVSLPYPEHKQHGKLWFVEAEFGYACCIDGIDEVFGKFTYGDRVRFHIDTDPPGTGCEVEGENWIEYPVDSALSLAEVADRMMVQLFGLTHDKINEKAWEEYDEGLFMGTIPDDIDSRCREDFTPGTIWYYVERL